MSWYLTIRSDSTYSQSTPTTLLVAYLASLPELRQIGPMAFDGKIGLPSVSVVLAECTQDGSYASNGEFHKETNVVELVCSDSEGEWFDQLAIKIAGFLGWDAFEDHVDRKVNTED